MTVFIFSSTLLFLKCNIHRHTPATLHVIWPGYSKYLHEFVTLIPGSLAERPTWHGHLAVDCAHRSVQGAQEHPQVSAAHQVHHRMERLRRREIQRQFLIYV